MPWNRLARGCAAHLLSALAVSAAATTEPTADSETEQVVRISVSSGRPLAEAIRTLEKRYGWVITYEDPPYVHSSEIADVTREVRRDSRKEPRMLVPRGRGFDFTYRQSQSGHPEAAAILEELLGQYHLSGNPALFRLLGAQPVFHVVPTMARNVHGVLETHHPVLDTSISVAADHRTALELLQAILAEVSRSTGIRVYAGTVPTNLLAGTPATQSITSQRARDALRRTLDATGQTLSWQLFYGPATQDYALNVHAVPAVQGR